MVGCHFFGLIVASHLCVQSDGRIGEVEVLLIRLVLEAGV